MSAESDSPPLQAAPAPPSGGENAHSYRTGPKIAQRGAEDALMTVTQAEGATWRGWTVGLLAVCAIAVAIPYVDFVMKGTTFSFNAFPMLSVCLLAVMLLAANLALHFRGHSLGLTRQDLALVFCMTMVVYSIPGVGFWAFWSTGMTAGTFHARPENNWDKLIHPFLPPDFFPHDPVSPNDPGPRPAEWFYTGLPTGETIPWGAWTGPFLRWSLVVACMYGLFLSVAALLSRRWSEQERLPFPVSQVPEEMCAGLDSLPGSRHKFFSDPVALWGIGLAFALASWNSMSSYIPNVPEIPLLNWNTQTKYLTEPPWNAVGTVHIHIFPTIIGLTFLLSLEVAFSLWFFWLVTKVLFFFYSPTYGWSRVREVTQSQGTGALLALVAFCAWLARLDLWRSLKHALSGEVIRGHEDEPHPSLIWTILLVSYAGAVTWLWWFGVSVPLALAIVALFVVVMTGLARLIAEAGVFAAQFYDFPVHMLSMTVTPAVMGAQNTVLLTIWDRMFTADWFRIVPLPNLMNALHLSGAMGLRRSTCLGGVTLAIALTFAVSFFTFLGTAYTQGGANTFGWFFDAYPQSEFNRIAGTSSKVKNWDKKLKETAESGKVIPSEEVPKVARPDWFRLTWGATGAAVMVGFMLLRRFIFWWPHPAGYLLWMADNDRLWFSFFLGWLLKWMFSKFGGMRLYQTARRFFIGLVVGEAMAAVFWVLIAILKDHKFAYSIRIC